MALILVPVTNVVRRVTFPATAARMVATRTLCSMLEVVTAKNTTLAMVVAMMDRLAYTILVLVLVLVLKRTLSHLVMKRSTSQLMSHVFAKARKGAPDMLMSLSYCMILVPMKDLSLLHSMEEVVRIVRVEVEVVVAGVVVAAAVVDVVTVETMEVMQEISPTRTLLHQQLRKLRPSLLKVIGLMLVFPQRRQHQAGERLSNDRLTLPE